MLAALLSLLGLGSVGGLVWRVGPLKALGFAKSAASGIGAAFKSFFGMLNAQGWVGLIACSIVAGFLVHQWSEARHWHKQSDQYQKLYNAELAHEAKIAKQAVDLKARIDALTSSISTTLKEWNDAQNARIASSANALRLSGPGKSQCRSPVSSAASSGLVAQGGNGNASGSQLPADDSSAVPWQWLVSRAEEHDLDRAEVLTWREWYRQIQKVWPKGGK